MLYFPLPIGRICRKCGNWFPRHLLVKNKKQPDGIEKHCLECSHAQNKRWADEHPGKMRQFREKWKADNPGKTEEAIRRWQKANPEKVREIDRRYDKRHPEKARAKTQLRTARKRALPSTFTHDEWNRCLAYFHGCCAYCGNPPGLFDKTRVLIQEHFIPVTSGGPYTPDNMLPACKSCNSQKWNLDPIVWLKKRFGPRKAKIILERIQSYFEWVKNQSG